MREEKWSRQAQWAEDQAVNSRQQANSSSHSQLQLAGLYRWPGPQSVPCTGILQSGVLATSAHIVPVPAGAGAGLGVEAGGGRTDQLPAPAPALCLLLHLHQSSDSGKTTGLSDLEPHLLALPLTVHHRHSHVPDTGGRCS